MNEMTKVQQDYIDSVILPKLIEMAMDGSLPMDMNDLSSYHFDEETKAYNSKENTVAKHQKQIDRLGWYLAEDDIEDALHRLECEDPCTTDMNDVVQMGEAFEDLGYMTIDKFWKDCM